MAKPNEKPVETPKLDLNDPAVKAAIEAIAAKRIESYKAAETKYHEVIGQYEKARADAEARTKAAAQPPKPDAADVADRWADRVVSDFVENEEFTPTQARKIMNFGRGIANEVINVSRAEQAERDKATEVRYGALRKELQTYQTDPARLFRDAENDNPEVIGKRRFRDVPSEIRARALELIRTGEVETDPTTAIKIAYGEKAADAYDKAEKEKLEKAKAAEGVPSGFGGIEMDPTGMPLPAHLDTADWAEFKEMAAAS